MMSYEVIFDPPAMNERLSELDKLMSKPEFWDDQETARDIGRERNILASRAELFAGLENDLEDVTILLDLALEESDEETALDIRLRADNLEEALDRFEVERMLSGRNDLNDAIVDIHAGAGGTEAQDWAEMLLRMYLRWADRHNFKTRIVDFLEGDEAGMKSVTFTVAGEYACGLLQSEIGIHRLVRISPFDTNRRRHTSFASVFVTPDLDDDIVVEVSEKDLRIDTYRASGAGGQHVNKTSSAVRITHIPSGIVVQCQDEKSQHRNKETAMKVLKARLHKLEEDKKAEELKEIKKDMKEIGWGSQIRSYVLHPYQMAKDHRTSVEVGNVDAVLDGDLEDFTKAFLMSDARQG
jgi:peptide chain release factor 2